MFGCLQPSGCKKKEDLYVNLAADLEQIIAEQTQIDPSFKTQRCYVKLSAPYIFKELVLHQGYELKDFCIRSVNNI